MNNTKGTKKLFSENKRRSLPALISLFMGIFFGLLIVFFFYANAPQGALAQSSSDLKSQLQARMDEVQNKIDVYRGQISQKQKEAQTLKGEISILETQISQIELEVEAVDISIKQLDIAIGEKEKEISKFNEQIGARKAKIAVYLRAIHEHDEESIIEMLLSNQSFSDFFDEIQALENIQEKIEEEVNGLQELKKVLDDEKAVLEDERDQQNQLRLLQENQRVASQNKQSKKESLLSQTKGQESLFKKLMEKAQSDVESIKNQMYMLEGVGLKMTLEEALKHAEYASEKSGVRPAFLLAILKKESSWGTNVGTGSWRSDMHLRDQKAFLEICKKLGFNPDTMPVSRKPSYGWGGAMGPAQFLPNTWLSYEDEIAKLTGHNPSNPWNTDDAFVASGIKLGKNGANIGTYDAEWKAAMIYFAGGRWNNPVYRFYGDSVMELAKIIQEQVEAIKGK
jgi:peptidoglycan hydrolase CwlO-like protein